MAGIEEKTLLCRFTICPKGNEEKRYLVFLKERKRFQRGISQR